MRIKTVTCSNVGRESAAHPAFRLIPSLDFDPFSTHSHAQLGNEFNQKAGNCYYNDNKFINIKLYIPER